MKILDYTSPVDYFHLLSYVFDDWVVPRIRQSKLFVIQLCLENVKSGKWDLICDQHCGVDRMLNSKN